MFGLGVGIDLGTSSVMIYVEGRGIVLTEPSVIACNTRGHFRHSAFEGRCCFRFPHDRKNVAALHSKNLWKPDFQAACDRLHAKLRDQSGKKDDP